MKSRSSLILFYLCTRVSSIIFFYWLRCPWLYPSNPYSGLVLINHGMASKAQCWRCPGFNNRLQLQLLGKIAKKLLPIVNTNSPEHFDKEHIWQRDGKEIAISLAKKRIGTPKNFQEPTEGLHNHSRQKIGAAKKEGAAGARLGHPPTVVLRLLWTGGPPSPRSYSYQGSCFTGS